MIIRKATDIDLPSLLELEHEYLQDEYDALKELHRNFHPGTEQESVVKDLLDKEDSVVFVAEECDDLIGFTVGILSPYPVGVKTINQGKIDKIFVRKKYRNQSISSQLHNVLIEWFKLQNCEYVGLVVFASNPANEIYDHWGFEPFMLNMKKKI